MIADSEIKLDQIIAGGDAGAPAGGKPAKGAKAPAADAVQFEEGDLEVPKEASNNFFLGDAVKEIICLNND